MAETSSPCLVRSFSQPSSNSYDGHEEDLLRALSSSISFGRYMSESLAWEKWSAFSHNKYREEAERYSRPGSVAEKKAFFEARYKKIAAKKAAASVEQPSNGADDHSSDLGKENQNYEAGENAKDLSTEEMQGEEVLNSEVSVTDGCYRETTKCGLPKPPLPVKPPSIQSKKTEHSATPSDEPIKTSSPILQKIVNSKLVRAITSSIQDSRSQKSPVSESGISLPKNATSELDVHVCMNSESAENVNRVVTEENRGEELPNPAVLSILGQTTVPKQTEQKQPSIQSKKTEHRSTPSRVNTAKGLTPQSAPLSLHLSDNVENDEPIKPSSPMLQRIANSKFVRAITNTARESRPQKSPFGASSYSSSKHGASEPETRRAILTGNLKSPPTAHGSKTTQPSTTICSSFVFRSEERAMKRKEFYQKLEQKLKEERQLQTNKAMSKRTNEPKAPSACASRAKPNATNHHTKEQLCSPKLGKKPVSSRVQENGSRPPWRVPGKSDSLKDVVGKTNKQPFVHSAKLFLKESRHENASPNIQQ